MFRFVFSLSFCRAAVSPAQVSRQRAVVVAIVKTLTSCSDYEQQYDSSYGQQPNLYEKQQSKPITAVKVNENAVDFVVDKFWEGALDYSCPAPKAYYPEPNYYPETPAPAPYSAPPQYSAPVYSLPPPYSPPVYAAPPPYNPPVYSPPPYTPPVYAPPPYIPPVYSSPPYSPPVYSPPAYNPPQYY